MAAVSRTSLRQLELEFSSFLLAALVSLGAGMLGGSVGVGVAYPLDTLKTKLQARPSGASTGSTLGVAAAIVREEGIGGFYGGCNELDMMEEIYRFGPVVGSFEPTGLMGYSGGIYSDWGNKNAMRTGVHGVHPWKLPSAGGS